MITLRGRIFFIIFFALLGLASIWFGAWAMHVVQPDSWMHFPIYFTSFIVCVGSVFGAAYGASLL